MGEQRLSYLSQNDTIMWTVETDPLLRSTIVGILLLDRVPDREMVEARVRRAIDNVPALRSTVARAPLHPTVLQWNPVAEVDLGYHLRHVVLPAPGSLPQLLDVARAAAASGFDRERPLWEFTLVEGLDGTTLPGGAQAAFVTKAHHVVTDGIGAIQLAANLFDLVATPEAVDANATEAGPTAPDGTGDRRVVAGTGTPPGLVSRWRDALDHDVDLTLTVAREQVRGLVPNLLHALRNPLDTVAEVVETAKSVGRTVAPLFDTKSPVMTERQLVSRFQTLEVPLDGLKTSAKAVGGTLNDAFLGGITGGLRRYHELHGAPVDELRMAMPISLRTETDEAGGNHVSVLRFTVPVGVADPAERLKALHEVGVRIRNERSLAHTEAIAGVLNLLPRGVIGTMLKHVDFLASNVPGMPVPLFLAGSEVVRFFPFGPTAGSSVNLTLVSYCGNCCIGVHTDTAAIPDGDAFLGALREGFDEVLALAR